jgi:hypothetical protein
MTAVGAFAGTLWLGQGDAANRDLMKLLVGLPVALLSAAVAVGLKAVVDRLVFVRPA